MSKKVLVLGATGAMGKYLVPKLLEMGYQVDAVALDTFHSDAANLRNIVGNAMDWQFRDELFKNNYDGIVDFMKYTSAELPLYLPALLDNTEHYIYLSSYRVYDNKEVPIKETSPRLLDTADEILLRNSDDYSIYKARGENVLLASPRKNWTAVRPAPTYSLNRYQLATLEAPVLIGRTRAGKSVVLPEQARDIDATMTWAGDVADMFKNLLFNEKALGEIYTTATAEHHKWGEIAEYYKDLIGLNAVWVDKKDYLNMVTGNPHNPGPRWQLECDRLFTRIIDNSKVLEHTGMKQSDLMPLYDGLKYELPRCIFNPEWLKAAPAMDEYLAAHGLK